MDDTRVKFNKRISPIPIIAKLQNVSFICLILSLLSWFLMLKFYGMDVLSFQYKIRSVMAIVGVLFYILFSIILTEYSNNNETKQMIHINAVLLVFSIIVFFDIFNHEEKPGNSDIVSRLSFMVGFGFVQLIQIIATAKRISISVIVVLQRCLGSFKSHILLILLICGVSLYLLITYDVICPMWDCALLYKYSSFFSSYTLYNFSSTFCFGHVSYAYAAIIAIISSLSNSIDVVISLTYSLSFLISICCFYGTIKIIVPGLKDITYVLSTGIYALSPFTIGMIHDPYLDLLTLFVFPIVIYFYFAKQYYIATVVAAAFLFIKEPAVIELGFFVLGLLIVELINNNDRTMSGKMAVVFKKKYLIMVFFAAVWLYIFMFVCHWEKSDGIAWTISFAIEEIKVVLGINFNWILLGLFCFCVLFSITHSHKYYHYLLPLCFSFFAMFCFLILYPTHNHPRYLGAIIAPLYLVACAGLCSLSKDIVRTLAQGLTLVIISISVFKTIDPVSKMVFSNIDIGVIGNAEMITTGDQLSDSMVYNSQYEGYQKVLNKAINEILKHNPDAIICMPADKGNIWYYDALGNWKEVDSSIVVEEYYDLNSGIRYSEYREGTIDLELTFVTSYADFNGIASQGETHLLYLPFVGTEESDEINKKCSIEREDEYSLNGWTLHDLVFR